MRKYKFGIIIHEGCDEFWEELDEKGLTGIEEITKDIEDALDVERGYDISIECLEFTWEKPNVEGRKKDEVSNAGRCEEDFECDIQDGG